MGHTHEWCYTLNVLHYEIEAKKHNIYIIRYEYNIILNRYNIYLNE